MGVLTTYEFTQDALRRQELFKIEPKNEEKEQPVSYTHLRAHET